MHRLAGVLLLTACVSTPPPPTTRHVAIAGTAEALVDYLSQTHATAEVCDARVSPNLQQVDTQRLVVARFLARDISPEVFTRCLSLALSTLDPTQTTSLLDTVVPAYETTMADLGFEDRPSLQAQLAALQQVLLHRPPETAPSPDVVEPRIERLTRLVERKALGPVARTMAAQLLVGAEFEAGRYAGVPVDGASLRALRDEAVLLVAAMRLPAASLRQVAATQLLRVRMAASPHPEVREGGDALISTVLRYGNNPQSFDADAVLEASLHRDPTWPNELIVTQPELPSKPFLLSGAAVMPTISLRGVVWVRVKGRSSPITVCGDEPFDPTPCLSPALLSVDSPLFQPLGHGRFEFTGEMSAAFSESLASADLLRVPVELDGQTMGWLSWGLRFERGEDLEYVAENVAETGPALSVAVMQYPLSKRYVFSVNDGRSERRRVVEGEDLAQFRVVSRGGRGPSGFDGANGIEGAAGAQCQNGAAGSPGQPGGNGRQGGRGGDVAIQLSCLEATCSEALLSLLTEAIVSEGGVGGRGGSGGAGGRGGAGGPAQVDSDGRTVCSAGASGADGPDGADGSRGPPGERGTVQFFEAPRVRVNL